MLGQRRRRWTNIEPTIAQCFVFAWQFDLKLATFYVNIFVIYFYACLATKQTKGGIRDKPDSMRGRGI